MSGADIRRLIELKKTSKKRVTHPLAKYNNLDQLVCLICDKVLKDDSLWNPHLQSKRHKENILLVKTKKAEMPPPQLKNCKKDIISKGTSSKLPNDFFGKGNGDFKTKDSSLPHLSPSTGRSKNPLPDSTINIGSSEHNFEKLPTKPKSILRNNSISQQQKAINTIIRKSTEANQQSLENNIDEPKRESLVLSSIKRKAEPDLPNNFFDKTEMQESNLANSDGKPLEKRGRKDSSIILEKNDASTIPEGFFDDPKKDAAARNVEYKDPKEKEWSDFQKVIQEETKVSEAIQEEDEEESEMLKDLSELNKMKTCLSKVEILKDLISKEKQKKQEMKDEKPNLDEFGDDLGSDEEIEMFDWRAKMA